MLPRKRIPHKTSVAEARKDAPAAAPTSQKNYGRCPEKSYPSRMDQAGQRSRCTTLSCCESSRKDAREVEIDWIEVHRKLRTKHVNFKSACSRIVPTTVEDFGKLTKQLDEETAA